MKKIAYISLAFLLIASCGGGEASQQQPEPPQQTEPQQQPEPPQQPETPQGPQGFSDEERQAAIDIVMNASDELLQCFENGFGKIYEEILEGYVPDDHEIGIIFACSNDPNSIGQPQGQQPQGQQPQGQQPQGQQPQGQDRKSIV